MPNSGSIDPIPMQTDGRFVLEIEVRGISKGSVSRLVVELG